jgi:hypothetical protein
MVGALLPPDAEVVRGSEPVPEPPEPRRPVLGSHVPVKTAPRVPTKAELLADEKRKRKAARRLELARRASK